MWALSKHIGPLSLRYPARGIEYIAEFDRVDPVLIVDLCC